jgi:AcrR family transcriptional regulator
MARTAVRSREDSKRKTREALVAAAVTLFAERGLDEPSLDDICERAGYTRGAFYVHFRDRDDLLLAVMQHVGRGALDELLGGEQTSGDLGDIARRFIRALATGSYPLTRAGGMRPYQLLDACARSPAIRAQYVALVNDGLTRLARGVREGQSRRAVRDDIAPEHLALLLVTMAIGVHTLLDLDVPMDLAGATSLLALLAPPARKRPSARRKLPPK